MNFAPFVPKSDCDLANAVQVKGHIMMVELRSYPSDPNVRGLLTEGDSHRVIILQWERQDEIMLNPLNQNLFDPETNGSIKKRVIVYRSAMNEAVVFIFLNGQHILQETS